MTGFVMVGKTPAHVGLNQAATGANARPFAHAAPPPTYATPRTRSPTQQTSPGGEAKAPADSALLPNPDREKRRAPDSLVRHHTGALATVCRLISRTMAHAWDCS